MRSRQSALFVLNSCLAVAALLKATVNWSLLNQNERYHNPRRGKRSKKGDDLSAAPTALLTARRAEAGSGHPVLHMHAHPVLHVKRSKLHMKHMRDVEACRASWCAKVLLRPAA